MKNWGKEHEEFWGIINKDENGAPKRKKYETVPGNYLEFYDNLYKAIRKRTELLVKPQEALNVIKIIDAAKQSAKKGCKILF